MRIPSSVVRDESRGSSDDGVCTGQPRVGSRLNSPNRARNGTVRVRNETQLYRYDSANASNPRSAAARAAANPISEYGGVSKKGKKGKKTVFPKKKIDGKRTPKSNEENIS